jgi:hypothetical protein
LLPADAPNFVAEEFALSMRARGVMPSLNTVRPLPERGSKVDAPIFQTGPSAATQQDGGTVSETDFDGATATAPKVTITGQSDISLQGWAFADGLDAALAAELGSAVATQLDSQIVSGIGSAGQMRGLTQVVGITSVAKTNGAPTGTTNYKAISDLVNQTAVAYGTMPDTLLLHPRRFAFITGQLAFAPNWFGLRPAVVNSIPTALGSGTNEDRVIAIPSNEIILHAGQPRIRVLAEVLAGTLQVRVQPILFAALLSGRKPAAIGVLSGTEVAAPTF